MIDFVVLNRISNSIHVHQYMWCIIIMIIICVKTSLQFMQPFRLTYSNIIQVCKYCVGDVKFCLSPRIQHTTGPKSLPSWTEALSLRGRSRSVRDCCRLNPVPVPEHDPLSPEDGDLPPPRPSAAVTVTGHYCTDSHTFQPPPLRSLYWDDPGRLYIYRHI